MKKLILTSFVLFASIGVLFASGCDSHVYADVNKSTLEIVLTSNNLQILKYTDYELRITNELLDLPYKILTELF
jgi:hypothetical protein